MKIDFYKRVCDSPMKILVSSSKKDGDAGFYRPQTTLGERVIMSSDVITDGKCYRQAGSV